MERSFSRQMPLEEVVNTLPQAIVVGERSSGKSTILHRLSNAFMQVKFVQLQAFDEAGMRNFLTNLSEDFKKLSMTKNPGTLCLCLDDLDQVSDPGALKMLVGYLRSNQHNGCTYLGVSLRWLELQPDFVGLLEWPFLYVGAPSGKNMSEFLRRELGDRALWLAGSAWGKEDQMERFIRDGIWENGKERGEEAAINAVRPGDLILLKSTFSHRTTKESILRIKAIGVVIENYNNGHVLAVHWDEAIRHLDFPGLGNYRRTFQRLLIRDVQEVLDYLLSIRPDLFERLRFLLEDEEFRRSAQEARGKNAEDLKNREKKKEEEVQPETSGSDAGSGGGDDGGATDAPATPGEPEGGDGSGIRTQPAEFAYAEAIASDQGDKDSLNFKRDAQALAALIALKDMKPPLAIALFGKWGSGKSFFMHAIEKYVRQLSKHQGFLVEGTAAEQRAADDREELFYRGIAHIKFNAWSYLDANLWAGLAHSLFEKLDLYIRDNTRGELERLKVQVKITKRLELLHSDLEHYEGKRSQLETLQRKLEHEQNDVLLKWFQPKYDAPVKNFLKMCGLEDKQIEKMLPSQLKPHAEKAADFFAYLRHNSYKVPMRILGIVALLWMFKVLCVPVVEEYTVLPEIFKSFWSYLTLSVVPVVIAAFNFVSKHRTFFKRLGGLLGEEEDLKTSVPESQNPDAVQTQLQHINKLLAQVREGIEEEKTNQSNITELAIQNFVAEIPAKEDYTKHLGIITTIRRDFETLSDLFAEMDKDPERAANAKEKQRIEELNRDRKHIHDAFKEGGFRKLDRIVLYIDDLDRCSDEKVLEVLQAVHLLMAFPLFIVIVGVDERCVNNALTYAQLKRYRGIDRELIDDFIHEIEPREYLEKIFQIPFQLPVASEAGVKQLIDDIIPDPAAVKPYEDLSRLSEAPADAEGDKLLGFAEGDAEYKAMSGSPDEAPEDEFATTDEEGSDEEEDEAIEEDEPTLVAVRPEAVRITRAEKEILQLLAPLVGNNPRTIKRYVNIFRIVKTHEQSAVQSPLDMAKVVFLLAMFIGERRKQAIELFKGKHAFTIEKYSEKNDFELYQILDKLRRTNPLIHEVLASKAEAFHHLLPFVERFSYKIVLNAPPEDSKPQGK